MARSEQPETFEFMLQPGGEIEMIPGGFVITGKNARLMGRVLSPAEVSMSVAPGLGEHVNVPAPFTLRIAIPERVKEAEFLVVLVPLAEGEAAPAVELREGVVHIGGDAIELSADGKSPMRRHRAGQSS
jgi:hypothetical protein